MQCADTGSVMRLQNHGRVARAILQRVFCKRTRHGKTRKDVVWFRILRLAWQRSGRWVVCGWDGLSHRIAPVAHAATASPQLEDQGPRKTRGWELPARSPVPCQGRGNGQLSIVEGMLWSTRTAGSLFSFAQGTREPAALQWCDVRDQET